MNRIILSPRTRTDEIAVIEAALATISSALDDLRRGGPVQNRAILDASIERVRAATDVIKFVSRYWPATPIV